MAKKIWLLLLLILAIAIFFRTWHLEQIPPGLYPDVAVNGNNALEALKTHDFKIFYPDNNGREGFFINLLSLSFYLFGASVWSIKIIPAIIGILTALGLFFLARNLFSFLPRAKSDFIALLSAFFIAISFWHVNFSRLGFRAIMVPFFLVWSFYFLFKALKATRLYKLHQNNAENTANFEQNPASSAAGRDWRKWPKNKNLLCFLWFILGGIFFGLGFHTYISFRVAPLILLPIIIFVIISYWPRLKDFIKEQLGQWLIFFVAIFLTALPIGFYFLQHPQDFSGRTGQVSVFAAASPLKELLVSTVKSLGMFNVQGDCNWRHNYACQPALLWPIGLFFIIGLIFALLEASRPSNYRQKRWLSLTTYWTLLFMFGAMLLPEILSTEGLPHALRSIGAIPPVFIFSGLGLFLLFEGLKILYFKSKIKISVLFVLLLATLAGIGWTEYQRYFIDWGTRSETRAEFTQNFVNMGDYLNDLPADIKKYVLVNAGGVPVPYPDGLPMPAQTIMFISHQTQIHYLRSDQFSQISCPGSEKCVVLFMSADSQKIETLQTKFRHGYTENIQNEFSVFKINF